VVNCRVEGKLIAELWQTCTATYLDGEGADSNKVIRAEAWAGEGGWGLTPRETMVASLLMEGKSDQQAADELQLAVGSINKHVQSILRKAGVSSRVELAERAGVVRIG